MTDNTSMHTFLRRLQRTLFGIGTALGAGAVMTSAAPAQNLNYREANAVPAAWQRFAQLVQYRFGEWLAADDEVAARFHVFLENRVVTEADPAETLVVRVWVAADGKVERIAFPAFSDSQANEDFRMLLTRGHIGEPPPNDMLQPLHMKVALNWRS